MKAARRLVKNRGYKLYNKHISLYARSWEKQYRPNSIIKTIQKENNQTKILNALKSLRPK